MEQNKINKKEQKMVFDLAKLKKDDIIIKNTDEIFRDTELKNDNFSITISPILPEDVIDIATNSVDEEGKISNGKYSKALFIASISNATGFTDAQGKTITVEDGIAEILWNYAPDKLKQVIKDNISKLADNQEKKSEEVKKDFNPTQLG